jgi:hypothetical protein
MTRVSPTLEGFRTAFRRPSLTFGEIMWRWSVGATACALFFFGLFEYLNTLPVTNGELLFLRTRHPFLVAEAIAHIFRGSLSRAVLAAMLAGLMLTLLWIVAASLGRMITVQAMLDYFRQDFLPRISDADAAQYREKVASPESAKDRSFRALLQLSVLRAVITLATLLGFAGATLLARLASPPSNPSPGVFVVLFLPMSALICLAWWALNWLLSLASVFAVRDGGDALSAISEAVDLCQERTGAVFAVSTWTGLAHLALFVAATSVIAMPLGVAGILPWRLIVLVVLALTLTYFAIADWLYIARLAGYVCIAEMPEALLAPAMPGSPPVAPPLQTTIDRDEPILSDVPGLVAET